MKKYNIEGNIDFYKELYKSLDDESGEGEGDENTKYCLITGELLSETHVVLQCKHTFNYVPLFKDLYNYKKKYSYMDSHYSKTKNNEIRCPYCRSKQTTLLPYYECIGVEKVLGINCDSDDKLNIIGHFKKGVCCWKECLYTYISQSAENNMDYCFYHLKKINKQFANDKKNAAKLKAKTDAKEAKMALLVNTSNENVILLSGMCKQTLKSGARKGHLCGAKTHEDGYCKRHYIMGNGASPLKPPALLG